MPLAVYQPIQAPAGKARIPTIFFRSVKNRTNSFLFLLSQKNNIHAILA